MKKNRGNLPANFVERRKSQRVDLPLKLRYRIIGRRGAEGSTKCINISGGGVKVSVGHPLEVGNKLELAIYIPNNVIIALGKVIWSRKTNGQFEGGLQFIKMSLKTEFTNYLCEQIVNLSIKRK